MKILSLLLCVCISLCVFVSCDDTQTDIYVESGSEQETSAESLTQNGESDGTGNNTSESDDANEDSESDESKPPEQTMGMIQEMIPKPN